MSGPTRGLRVLKFGGSSLRKGEDVDRIAELILSRQDRVVIVVSALQGVTDLILSSLPEMRQGEANVRALMDELTTRHTEVLADCDPSPGDDGLAELAPVLEKLERLLYGIAYTEELTAKTKDLAVSFGERLSARLLAAALKAHGGTAEAFDADAVGIVTDGVFGIATARMEPTTANVQRALLPFLDEGGIPVVTGFFGHDGEGHVTTFGRGGSDYSAAVLSRALGAEALEVWKDVDGFLTADPNRVAEARPLSYMTYDEAAELAYLGAKVLHPRTVEPLHDEAIPILVKNTMNPSAPGTHIGPSRDEPEHLRAIGAREGFAIVRLLGSGMAWTPGVARDVFHALGEAGINVVNMAASQASFALLVDERDADRARELVLEAHIPTIEGVEVSKGFALVTFVGENIGSHEGVAGEVFTAVGRSGVNVEMISVGASAVALAFVVHTEDVRTVLHALHDNFLAEDLETLARPPGRE